MFSKLFCVFVLKLKNHSFFLEKRIELLPSPPIDILIIIIFIANNISMTEKQFVHVVLPIGS